MLRTAEQEPNDIHSVGFCPRYLLEDILDLLTQNPRSAQVAVERISPPPAPLQFRLLCSLTLRWPAGFQPFSGNAYQPIPQTADIAAG